MKFNAIYVHKVNSRTTIRRSKHAGRSRFFFSLSFPKVVAFTDGYTVNKTLSFILQSLENVTAIYSAPRVGHKSSQMYQRDLKASVDALTRLIKYNAINKNKPLSNQHDIKNLVKASSNLLRITNLPAWKNSLEVNLT